MQKKWVCARPQGANKGPGDIPQLVPEQEPVSIRPTVHPRTLPLSLPAAWNGKGTEAFGIEARAVKRGQTAKDARKQERDYAGLFLEKQM